MPTIRVISLKDTYDHLNGHRREIATALRAATSNLLNEDIEGVEAFWFAPIAYDDAVNVLPISVDVEFSAEIDEKKADQLADALLWVLTKDPFSSAYIPFNMKVGVWIKTPHLYYWKETTKEVKQTIARRSYFPFSEDVLLVVTAPDAPHAHFPWEITTQTVDGHQISAEHADILASLWVLTMKVSKALDEAIYSPDEVEKHASAVQSWLNDVYEAYYSRTGRRRRTI
jgi:hypothetical protein